MTSDVSALAHLQAVAKVTAKSRDIALAALHEARTRPVAEGRVRQLRQVAQDLNREVGRLETAMDELAPDADFDPSGSMHELVRESGDGPAVRTPDKQAQLDTLARIARMASGVGPARPAKSYDRSMGKPVRSYDSSGGE